MSALSEEAKAEAVRELEAECEQLRSMIDALEREAERWKTVCRDAEADRAHWAALCQWEAQRLPWSRWRLEQEPKGAFAKRKTLEEFLAE